MERCPLRNGSGKVFKLPTRTIGYTFGPNESRYSLDEHYEECSLCRTLRSDNLSSFYNNNTNYPYQ